MEGLKKICWTKALTILQLFHERIILLFLLLILPDPVPLMYVCMHVDASNIYV